MSMHASRRCFYARRSQCQPLAQLSPSGRAAAAHAGSGAVYISLFSPATWKDYYDLRPDLSAPLPKRSLAR